MSEKLPGARLLTRTGGFAGLTHQFVNEASLGRSANNDVRLNSPYLSSRHARIYFQDGEYFIEDLGSRNGTRVDGVAVARPVCLERVNVISLADTIDLVFVRTAGVAADAHESKAGTAAAVLQEQEETVPSSSPASTGVRPAGQQEQVPAATSTPTASETRYDIALPTFIDPRAGGSTPPVPSAPAIHELELKHADGQKQIFPLKAGSNVLGRADTCDVVLPDAGRWLSRQHATLTIEPDGVTLTDHGTVNGTFLADQRIQSVKLEAGAVFRIGPQLELKLIRR